jgi:hypothetical protein
VRASRHSLRRDNGAAAAPCGLGDVRPEAGSDCSGSAWAKLRWKSLQFENGVANNLDVVIDPIRKMADKTIDAEAVIGGIFLPGTISDRIEKAYRDILFGNATLQDPLGRRGSSFRNQCDQCSSGSLISVFKTVHGGLFGGDDSVTQGFPGEGCRRLLRLPSSALSLHA